MKLAILWVLSSDKTDNEITYQCLLKELQSVTTAIELVVYKNACYDSLEYLYRFSAQNVNIKIDDTQERNLYDWYNQCFEVIDSDYVTAINSGDVWREGSLKKIIQCLIDHKEHRIFSMVKELKNKVKKEKAPFTYDPVLQQDIEISLDSIYSICPTYFWGNWVHKDIYSSYRFDVNLGIETEKDFFLRVMLKEKSFYYLYNKIYYLNTPVEGDFGYYPPAYEREWYYESIRNFWMPFLQKIRSEYKEIPLFIQYQAIFSLYSRFDANLNNRNKHLLEGDELVTSYMMSYKPLLDLLSDRVVFNIDNIKSYNADISFRWFWGIIKYGSDFKFDLLKNKNSGEWYFGYKDLLLEKVEELRVNLSLLEFEDGCIEIDGELPPILYALADELYLRDDNTKYKLEYNERYGLTKVFGKSIYKQQAFHVKVPLQTKRRQDLSFVAVINGHTVKQKIQCKSHFSKLSQNYPHSYWFFGDKEKWIGHINEYSMIFKPSNHLEHVVNEGALWLEMLFSKDIRSKKFLLLRMAYHICKPVLKRRPVWMYMDKIYKGADSSEYIYRYAASQPEKIDHYYLIDKKSMDYHRLIKDGYRPLVRGSFKHRLIFLYADMLIASNSTVCPFNNYGLPNSSYMRDLLNFNVCCVQHGMSVQKIAIAQNRLKDNTKLYFCASKYEIQNLSKPVYDYVKYDALKLTGVPRYDGLVDRHKRQIMISPTWRMQSAVPVRTSEGHQRDYNPLFKESTYFKVYNSLINDARLIEAAQIYGYKIKYILHPIVSSQAKDFDRNEYVDIVPSVGDMSYEDMFCESALMVTDFSGVQFDFAYMRKPVVYLHHEDIPPHYEEGAFFYDTMGFGEICHNNDELIDLLCKYMKEGCQMKEKYVKRADDFFEFDDHRNCERIYAEMLKYQYKKQEVMK